MLFLILILTFFGLIMWIKARHELKKLKKSELALSATYDYCDLGDKIIEMTNDPDVMKENWLEILPICEFAENRWFETHPYLCREKHGGLVKGVKIILEQYR